MPSGEISDAALPSEGAATPRNDEIAAELERLLADSSFRASVRRRNFLRYLVEQTLCGQAAEIKAYTIATTVFGRGRDFDPQIDPIVRIEAMRLRRDIEHYYLTAGDRARLTIGIPKGSYVPTFAWRAAERADPRAASAESGSRAIAWPRRASAAWAARPQFGLRAAAAITLLVILAYHAGALWPTRIDLASDRTPASAPARPRIVVTPFASPNTASDRAFLAIGITEDIVGNLSRFLGLRVVWTAGHGRVPDDPTAVGDYELHGSIRQGGDRIKISVQLLDRQTATVAWADQFDHALDPTDIYSFTDIVARRVAATIGSQHGIIAQLGVAAAQRKAPDKLSSYECVLRAHELQRTLSVEGHAAVRSCLEKAVAVDPLYGDAWASLSWAYGQENRFKINTRPHLYDAQAKTMEAARRAVEVASDSPIAHLALALAHFDIHDLEAFRMHAQKALRLNPNNPTVLSHVGLRTALSGDWDRGLPMLEEALTLNANHPTYAYLAFSLYHYGRGEYEIAAREVAKASVPGNFWPPAISAMCLAMQGRDAEARNAVAQLLALKPGFADQFRELVGYWNLPGPLVQSMAEGLRRAGVEVR